MYQKITEVQLDSKVRCMIVHHKFCQNIIVCVKILVYSRFLFFPHFHIYGRTLQFSLLQYHGGFVPMCEKEHKSPTFGVSVAYFLYLKYQFH